MALFSVVLSSSGFFALRRTIFFFRVRGKNSIVPFLCKEEEEFITPKEEDKEEDKEDKELKKRSAELFRSRSVSRSLSSSLSAGAKRERESGVFFSKE